MHFKIENKNINYENQLIQQAKRNSEVIKNQLSNFKEFIDWVDSKNCPPYKTYNIFSGVTIKHDGWICFLRNHVQKGGNFDGFIELIFKQFIDKTIPQKFFYMNVVKSYLFQCGEQITHQIAVLKERDFSRDVILDGSYVDYPEITKVNVVHEIKLLNDILNITKKSILILSNSIKLLDISSLNFTIRYRSFISENLDKIVSNIHFDIELNPIIKHSQIEQVKMEFSKHRNCFPNFQKFIDWFEDIVKEYPVYYYLKCRKAYVNRKPVGIPLILKDDLEQFLDLNNDEIFCYTEIMLIGLQQAYWYNYFLTSELGREKERRLKQEFQSRGISRGVSFEDFVSDIFKFQKLFLEANDKSNFKIEYMDKYCKTTSLSIEKKDYIVLKKIDKNISLG